MGRVVRIEVERSRILEAYKSSGLSVAEFSSHANISPSTLYQWISRAKTQNTDVPVVRVARVIRRRRPRKKAVRPPQENAPRGPHSTTVITVEVGEIKVHVSAGFDAATLAVVLNLLEERASHGGMP
jgi:transposase-like protein